MASQAVTSGAIRNRQVMLSAGSDTTKTVLLTQIEANTQPKAFPRVPAASLSNSGTAADPISGGSRAKLYAGRYVGMMMSDFIANVASTVLKSGSAEFLNHSNRHNNNSTIKVRALGVNTWASTGIITKGGTSGDLITLNADNEATSPIGEFSYRTGAANPVSADYSRSF